MSAARVFRLGEDCVPICRKRAGAFRWERKPSAAELQGYRLIGTNRGQGGLDAVQVPRVRSANKFQGDVYGFRAHPFRLGRDGPELLNKRGDGGANSGRDFDGDEEAHGVCLTARLRIAVAKEVGCDAYRERFGWRKSGSLPDRRADSRGALSLPQHTIARCARCRQVFPRCRRRARNAGNADTQSECQRCGECRSRGPPRIRC